jgi:hypothetical protein
MAISNLVTLDTSTPGTKAGTAATANVLYTAVSSIPAGIYSINCVSTTVARVELYNGTTLVTSQVTTSGTVSFNLGTDCTSIRFWTDTGTDVVVSLQYVASPFSVSSFSGTLDTITSSTTYTQTGKAYAILVGGGGGGSAGQSGAGGGGGGGSGGVLSTGVIDLTGSMAITVGTGGNGANSSTAVGNAGNATTFAGFTANGGGAANASTGGGNNNAGGGGAAGTPGGGAGGSGQAGNSTGGQNGSASSSGSFAAYAGNSVTTGQTSSTFSNDSIYIPNYAGSAYKSYSADGVVENNATGAFATFNAGLWSNTAAITSITLTAGVGSFVQYSNFYLYGVKNA